MTVKNEIWEIEKIVNEKKTKAILINFKERNSLLCQMEKLQR